MTKNGNTITWRLLELEKRVGDLSNRMDLILENHLPHLKLDVESLKTRVNVATAINVSAIILGVLISKYL
jgi:hypothetical protein